MNTYKHFQIITLIFFALHVLAAICGIGNMIYFAADYSLAYLLISTLDAASAFFFAIMLFILALCLKEKSGNSRYLMLGVLFGGTFRCLALAISFGAGISTTAEFALSYACTILSFVIPYLYIGAMHEKLMACDFKNKKPHMQKFHEVYRTETHALWDHIMDMRNRLKAKKAAKA